MSKEFEAIQQLEAGRDRLSSILEEGNAVIGRRSDKALQMKEEVGTTFEATLKYGRYNKASDIVKKTVSGLTDRLNRVDQELEPHAVEFARKHMEEVSLRRNQLAEMSELVAGGNLTEKVLRLHQQQYEDIVKLPETNPLLQKGLDRIKQEEEERKKEKAEASEPVETEEKPKTYSLPNGEVIGGKIGELLYHVSNGSEDNLATTDQLIHDLFSGVEYRIAKHRLQTNIARARRQLKGSGIDLVNANIAEKYKYIKAGYYLRKQENLIQGVEIELPKAASKVDAFIQQLPEKTGFLLAEVRRSEDFRYAAEVVSKFVPQDDQTVEELRASVVGYLFETLAYSYLKKQFADKNKVLLSPDETFEIYYRLNPSRRKIDDKYGLQKGIEGISVPDGIVLAPVLSQSKRIKEVRIDGICEYMLGTNNKPKKGAQLTQSPGEYRGNMRYLVNQTNPESMGVARYINSRYPTLPNIVSVNNNLDVYVVLPSGVETPLKTPGIEEISIPISTFVFRQFISAFMCDIQERKGFS